jgi:hypothetical protein
MGYALKGMVTICRRSCSGEDATIALEITDDTSGGRLVDLVMSPEAFGNAVTGLGAQPCKYNLGRVELAGKIREAKEEFVPEAVKHCKLSREEYALENCKPFMVDGWTPRGSHFGNSHYYQRVGGQGGYRVIFFRYVDAPGGEKPQ